MINKFVSGGGSGKAKVDEVTGSIKLGKNAGVTLNSDDDNNVAIGTDSLNSVTTNSDGNIAIGTSAGTAITTGDDNVCIGTNAGAKLTDGNANIAIGKEALDLADLGEAYNVAIGYSAMGQVNFATSDNNVAIGVGSLYGQSGQQTQSNVAMGYSAMGGTSGQLLQNIAIGQSALSANGTKTMNVAIGHLAGNSVTTGAQNVIVGAVNGGPTTGARNVLLGYSAGDGIEEDKTVDNHVMIGTGGGFKKYSGLISLADFTTVGDNKAATSALIKFPQYGFIKSITCTVSQASLATGVYNISLGTASDESPGDTVAGQVELIGAGASDLTGCVSRTQAADAAGDSNVDIITVKQLHMFESDLTEADNNGAWMANDMYLYVCHANAGNSTHAANTILLITAEWFGID